MCKLFFRNTLDINDRPIRTVIETRNKVAENLLEPDQRGKHTNHKQPDPAIREGIKKHIDSIPRIESHYLHANTSRQFIDGSRILADIYRDNVAACKERKENYGSYTIFYQIFNRDFNISLLVPKKDQCEQCVQYDNSAQTEKENLKEAYDLHQEEKKLSRPINTSIFKIKNVKVIKIEQNSPSSIFYKNPYKEKEFQEVSHQKENIA